MVIKMLIKLQSFFVSSKKFDENISCPMRRSIVIVIVVAFVSNSKQILYFELNLAVWGELQFKSNKIKSNKFMPMIKHFFFANKYRHSKYRTSGMLLFIIT